MRPEDLRPALYHRLHYLMPVVSHPGVRLLGRAAVRSLVVLYFGFVLLVLALRYLILPNIESYRPEIERYVSQTLGLTVVIGKIEASWQGINPDLILSDVRIADRQGQPALAFTRVESVLSWSSLPRLQIRLRLLRIDAPTLHLRRDADGQFYVAGIAVAPEGSDSGVADWVLAQKRIRINGATVVWDDARRGAPPLILEDLNFALDNQGRQHRFGPGRAARCAGRADRARPRQRQPVRFQRGTCARTFGLHAAHAAALEAGRGRDRRRPRWYRNGGRA